MELKNAKYGKFCIFTWKIVIKSEKNMDGGVDVGVLLHGLCTLPNIVINTKIMKKSAKSQEKRGET